MVGTDELASLYWIPSEAVAYVPQTRRAADNRLVVAPNCTPYSDANPLTLVGLGRGVDVALTY